MNQIVLLGPQRTRPTVAAALEGLQGRTGRVAVISAGWQEREGELEHLSAHLAGIELVDLALFARAEKVFETDADLHNSWHELQVWLKELRRLYRRRLRHTLRAARELDETRGIDALIATEREDALETLRELDRLHLQKVGKIQFEHSQRWQSVQRPAVAHQRQEIADLLEQCDTLLIAGGHVGVLLNRLRLFDIAGLIGDKALVAWSAGAMALSERIVLFHDFPPQGAGNAEVFDTGLAVCPNLVVFPDASRRLELNDSKRVALLADRLLPAVSLGLEEDSIVRRDGENWQMLGATPVLSSDGTVKVHNP